jgi:hypothetical protein
MTQYDELVERQRQAIEALEWAQGIKCVHIHQLKSMWYDDRPQDTDNGNVTDIQYNSGVIVRSKNGKNFHTFGEAKTGNALTDSYLRHTTR